MPEEIKELPMVLEEIEAQEKAAKLTEDEKFKAKDELQEHLEELENLESQPQEIFEWWIISDWLSQKGICRWRLKN